MGMSYDHERNSFVRNGALGVVESGCDEARGFVVEVTKEILLALHLRSFFPVLQRNPSSSAII